MINFTHIEKCKVHVIVVNGVCDINANSTHALGRVGYAWNLAGHHLQLLMATFVEDVLGRYDHWGLALLQREIHK